MLKNHATHQSKRSQDLERKFQDVSVRVCAFA